MKTEATVTKSYEFCFPRLDTLVQVENWSNRVIIRATRDTFSAERKTLFVRELAAEGFIPDDYQWFSYESCFSRWPVAWVVDFSWLKLSSQVLAKARHFMVRLLVGGALLWLVLMAALLCSGVHDGLYNQQPPASVLPAHG